MRKRYSPAMLAGFLGLCVVCTAQATGYEAYYDLLPDAPAYDGVQATIQYQPTVVAGRDLAVWIGLDSWEEPLSWMQGGWGQRSGGDPLIYWEYVGSDGVHHLGEGEGEGVAPGDNELYVVQHQGANAEWTHDGDIYKQVPWADFTANRLIKAQYGAEMQEEADHTPGVVDHKNTFSGTRVRRVGGNYASAPLAVEVSTAPQGNVERVVALPGSDFRTWDNRP